MDVDRARLGVTASGPTPVAPAARFSDVTLGYGGRPAIHGLDGSVEIGDALAIVGPNGAGKSTVLKGVVGEAEVLGGSIELPGRRVRDVAYLPQRVEIDMTFPIDVDDFVATGAWRRLGAWRAVSRPERERVLAALETVGLTPVARRQIGALSGGQIQRALFARAIVQDCSLILLDEPFAAIDEGATDDLLAVILGWRRAGKTVLAALHDLRHVRSCFPTTLVLGREPVAWGPTEAVLTDHNLARARRLMDASSADGRPAMIATGAERPSRAAAARRAAR